MHQRRLRLGNFYQSLIRANVVLFAMIALTACSSPAKPTKPQKSKFPDQITSTDACSQRLHDLSGSLLLYYSQHQSLPPTLAGLDLTASTAPAGESTVCPISTQPYVYDPRGLPAPDGKSRMVIYDSVPDHAGRRWAVTIIEPGGGQPLVTDVVAVPDSYFTSSR